MYYVCAMVSNGLACLPKISGPALDKRCHGKILRKDHQDFPGEIQLENNHHSKFKDC